MRKMMISLSTLSLLTACGFTPVSGAYTMSGISLEEDSCDLFEGEFDPDEVDDEDMRLTYNADDKSLTVSIGDEDETEWACTLDGKLFTCTPNVMTEENDGANISQSFGLSGEFTEANIATFEMNLTIDCEGANCGMAGIEFPCVARIAGTATGPTE